MRILIANLRLFFQRRMFWTAYLWLVVGPLAGWTLVHTGSAAAEDARRTVPVGVLLLILGAGSLVGNMRCHIVSHTVFLLLPGQRLAWRRVTLLGGLIVAFVGAFFFVGYVDVNDIPSGRLTLALLTAFGANLAVYLIGACTASDFMRVAFGPLMIGHSFVFVGFYGRTHSDSLAAVTNEIIGHGSVVIPFAAATAIIAWLRLGRQERHQVSRRARRIGTTRSARGQFILARARHCDCLTPAKYVWAALYTMSRPSNPWRVCSRLFMLVNSVCVVIVTYLSPEGAPALAILIFAVGPFWSHGVPLYGKMVLTAGREERFLATMASLIVFTGAVILSITVPVIALDLLGPILAWFNVGAVTSGYTPIRLWVVLLLSAVVPVSSFLDLEFYDEPGLLLMTKVCLGAVMVIAIHVVLSWATPVPLLYVVLFTVLPWGLCALGVHNIAMQSDLVSQRQRARESRRCVF